MPFRIVGATLIFLLAAAAEEPARLSRLPLLGPAAPAPGVALEKLFPDAELDPAIPTQQQLTGIPPGGRPLRHPELVRYFEALAAASPRARIVPYATSYEGRSLFVLAVGDESVVADLDAFRAAHAERVDPRVRPAARDGEALRDARAVAWVAYGIHGDELSSVDAAAAVAYRLVAGEDPKARRMRRELLVLIDPCENPDGRERYLAQTTAFAHSTPNPDQDDLSHATVWPWGRGNHYLFDLNRDWFTLVHPESARTSMIGAFHPQLMVDAHEMGENSSYLFPPARHPFNPLMGDHVRAWWERFAAGQARALDERGYPYFTREWNEEFFPGYGSSWAIYTGSVGILYEMSGTGGTVVKKRGGVLRDFAQAVEHQVASTMANLTTLLDNRQELLGDYVAARRDAIERGRRGPVRAWVIPPGHDPGRTEALADLLRRQTIEVLRLSGGAVEASGLRDARSGETRTIELPPGSFLVPLDQPAGNLARVLLDPHVPMDAEFFREEREYLERGKGSRLYDTTSWSLILSQGIEAYWTDHRPAGDWRPFGPGDPTADLASGVVADFHVAVPPAERGKVFGYLFDGGTDASVRALAELLGLGVRVKVADRPFGVGGREYTRGSVLIERESNEGSVADAVAQVAGRFRVEVATLTSARTESGPDLGGSHFRELVAPRVGVWTGMPVSPSVYGALWHLLDHELKMRFSGIDLGRFESTDLSRYNVLVFLPTFGDNDFHHALGSAGLRRLKDWVRAGGTAIGIARGAEFLADDKTGLTRTRLRRQSLDRYPPVVWGIGPHEAEAAGRFRAVGIQAPQQEEGKQDDRAKGAAADGGRRSSPYDVAPVIGPGARPFVGDTPQGTPVSSPPRALADWLAPLLPPGQEGPQDDDLERADERLRRFAPQGAHVRVELDNEWWLAWGLPPALDALIRTETTLVAEPPVQVPARFADLGALQLGGLLWPEAAGRLARTAYLAREQVGRGQVILFVDDPNFRAWTLGTRRLLLNAILYGPGLGAEWSSPW